MNKKFYLSLGIIIFSIFCSYLFSKQGILLSIIFIFIALIKHKLYPIKKELLWFSMFLFGGAITEVMLVNSHSAWNYSYSHLLGVPIWIPFFWGVLGTTIIVLYKSLTEK